MGTRQLYLTCILTLFFGIARSQKIVLKLIPSYSISFGTYQAKRTSMSSDIFFKNKSYSNVSFSNGSLGLDLTLVEFRNLNFGFSLFTGGAKTNLSYGYRSLTNISISSSTTEILENQGNGTSIRQLGLFTQLSFLSLTYSKIQLISQFSIYAYYLKDKTYFLPLYDNKVILTDGIIESNYENYKDIYEGKSGVACALRYDLSLKLRSTDRNIINLFFAYQQGLLIMDKISLDVSHTNGNVLKASATSRGSLFTVGIAKPIYIYPLKWLKNKAKI